MSKPKEPKITKKQLELFEKAHEAYKSLVQQENYIATMRKILEKSEQYRTLFIKDPKLILLEWFICQDETDYLAIDFSQQVPVYRVKNSEPLSAEQAAKMMYKEFPIETIVECFIDSVKEPLGKHLAQQALSNLEKQLLTE